MYRQIRVVEEDQDVLRVIWRESSEPLRDWRLTTVNFGQKAAPYLAIKTLQHLSHKLHEPLATVLGEHFYVDDLLSGSGTPEEAADLQIKIQQVLSSAGFPTHKWATNCPSALNHLEPASKELAPQCEIISPDLQVKTLGIKWQTTNDCFVIITSAVTHQPNKKLTRRIMLSAANTLYDPLGWLSPITITAKLQIQLVKDTKNWDDPLDDSTSSKWAQWTKSLLMLEAISIPRKCATEAYYLCGFSDASEKAYAAVVYAVTTTGSEVSLVAAKTKVSPLKPLSLPRLELLASLLLSKLIKAVPSALPRGPEEIFVWTDSTITLQWVTSAPGKFVANRVVQIQEVLSPKAWHHVSSKDNPADLPSRGIPADELKHSTLWLPSFQDQLTQVPPGEPEEERKAAVCCALTNSNPPELFQIIKNFSSWSRLRRFVARCFKMVRRVRDKTSPEHLIVSDFDRADLIIIKSVQQYSFADEYQRLLTKTPVCKKSVLACLNPILNKHGLICVGGRLHKAKTLTHGQKHPIILPRNHHLTQLIVRHYHAFHMHSGLSATEAVIRSKYWIIHGRNTIKKVLRTCVPCAKQKAITARQMMASLPEARVSPNIAFAKCGVDFAGPVTLKTQLARGTRHYKAWIALFVCFTTRAIHLELVTSLPTSAFMAALQRFTSRRGTPSEIWSDQGTNFKGAANEMSAIIEQGSTTDALAERGIKFNFNPAGAPHFGGLWEAGVKSMKTHLPRTIGLNVFTYEEYYTILCRTEAALNSRPLLPLTNDPDDLQVVTPAHFLIQTTLQTPPEEDLTDSRPLLPASSDPDDLEAITPAHFLVHGQLHSLPEEDFTSHRVNLLSRWQLVQKLSQQIWRRWSSEYLTRLQQRPKWWRPAPNLQPGTLVLIQDPNRSSLEWRMGRIVATHPGADGLVRVATVKTSSGEVQRPIHKLAPLPLDTAAVTTPAPPPPVGQPENAP